MVLILSGGALLFAAGEAHAQQRSTPEVHATVAGPERTPGFQIGLGGAATGTLPAYSSPLQVAERGTGRIPGAEPYPVTSSAPAPALKLLEELYPASWIELLPEAAMSESLGAKFRPDPAYDPALAPLDSGFASVPWYAVPLVDPPPATGPYGFGSALLYPGPMPEPVWRPLVPEEYKPLPWRIEEKPPVLSPNGTFEGVRSAPHQGNGAAEAVPVGPLPPFADRKPRRRDWPFRSRRRRPRRSRGRRGKRRSSCRAWRPRRTVRSRRSTAPPWASPRPSTQVVKLPPPSLLSAA